MADDVLWFGWAGVVDFHTGTIVELTNFVAGSLDIGHKDCTLEIVLCYTLPWFSGLFLYSLLQVLATLCLADMKRSEE